MQDILSDFVDVNSLIVFYFIIVIRYVAVDISS